MKGFIIVEVDTTEELDRTAAQIVSELIHTALELMPLTVESISVSAIHGLQGLRAEVERLPKLPDDWRCPSCKSPNATVNTYGLVTCINSHESH